MEASLFVPKWLARVILNLSRMILVNTFPRMDSSIIPVQLFQGDRSPSFGSLTRWFFFQSSGILSCSQILCRSGYSISVEVLQVVYCQDLLRCLT